MPHGGIPVLQYTESETKLKCQYLLGSEIQEAKVRDSESKAGKDRELTQRWIIKLATTMCDWLHGSQNSKDVPVNTHPLIIQPNTNLGTTVKGLCRCN